MATRKRNGTKKSTTRASTRATFVAAQRHADANDRKHWAKKESAFQEHKESIDYSSIHACTEG